MVRILSGDSDIFVLLWYWTWRYDFQVRGSVQMEKWDGVVLDINATCANLGDTVCPQLFEAHALSGCDTVSYLFGKGKASVLKTLKAGNFPGLFDVLGEGVPLTWTSWQLDSISLRHCMDNPRAPR